MDLSDSEDRPADTGSGGPTNEAGARLREQPPVVERLAARIADPDVLRGAWNHVHRAGGAPGIDSVDLATFGRELNSRVDSLARRLGDGSHAPQSLRAVRLPRHIYPRQRELMIPAVEDRLAMRALLELAASECDRVLLPCAFGYRSGRSVYNAVVVVQRAVLERPWVVYGDIQDFFGSVEHDTIVETLARFFDDPATRSLLGSWVMAPAQRGGVTLPRERGLPLGTPVSPLIANLVLHPLDRGLWGGERTYLRYADDFVICCADEQAAHDAMGVAQTLLEALGLTMTPRRPA